MRWQLKWTQSKAMQQLYENRSAKGQEGPPPVLRADLQGYWVAWQRLRHDRQHAGMSGVPLGIPFTAIERYAERYGYRTMTAFEELRELVTALDGAFLAHEAQKHKPPEGTP